MLLLHSRVPKACKYLSRDEAAEAHVHVLHKRHAEQGQTRLYACQDLAVPCQRVCSPFRLPARKLFLHRLEALGVETLRPKKALVQQALAARVKPAAHPSIWADFVVREVSENILDYFDRQRVHRQPADGTRIGIHDMLHSERNYNQLQLTNHLPKPQVVIWGFSRSTSKCYH